MGYLYPIPSLKTEGSWRRGAQKDFSSQRQRITTRKQYFLDTAGQLRQHMQGLGKLKSDIFSSLKKGGRHVALPLAKKQWADDGY